MVRQKRPSEIYKYRTREEVLDRVKLYGYRVIAFRAPDKGEIFWSSYGSPMSSNIPYLPTQPRLILEKL